MRNNQKGFAHVGILILVVLISAIALAGWFVSRNQSNNSGKGSVICTQVGAPTSSQTPVNFCQKTPTNYKECLTASGSKMIETYPEQCVDKNGNSWPNPAQAAGARPDLRQ